MAKIKILSNLVAFYFDNIMKKKLSSYQKLVNKEIYNIFKSKNGYHSIKIRQQRI